MSALTVFRDPKTGAPAYIVLGCDCVVSSFIRRRKPHLVADKALKATDLKYITPPLFKNSNQKKEVK